jgi:penicillin-binding protein 2
MAPLAPAAPSIIRNSENWEPVLQGMIAVVNGGGTASGIGKDFPYIIAGKTGTAERFSRTDETWTNIMSVAVERHQVFFEAFTPAEEARVAVIAALEAGRSGSHDAAPIVRKILDEWLKDDDDKGAADKGVVAK